MYGGGDMDFWYQNGGLLCTLDCIVYHLDVRVTRRNGAFGLPKLTPLTRILRN